MAIYKHTPSDFDFIFLSFDEPSMEYNWEHLRALVPHAQRVHGVLGFDAAHKACARLAHTERFFIVDGDNFLNKNFLSQSVTIDSNNEAQTVFSWSALNNINGLMYGNGGVKLWPKKTLLEIASHENAISSNFSVDFCFGVSYKPQLFCSSFLTLNGSPFQAFRAGFREGVKFCLNNGSSLYSGADLKALIPKGNYSRLLIWCTVGRDVVHGVWAMLGARLAVYMLYFENLSHQKINDYAWLQNFWSSTISPLYEQSENAGHELEKKLLYLGETLKQELNLNIVELREDNLRFFRDVHVNPSRTTHLEY